MKQKRLCILFASEGALCILLAAGGVIGSGIVPAAMAFPFEQIGEVLRALSLSGSVGNLFAILLYAALSLIPLFYLLIKKKTQALHWEDGLLAVLSGLLFFVLYLMINPAYLGTYLGGAAESGMGKAVLGTITDSLIVGYLILCLLRQFFAADRNQEKLQRYLKILLLAWAAVLVYSAFGSCLGAAIDSFRALRASNAGTESALGLSGLFLALNYLIGALPYLLDILIVLAILNLLEALLRDRYSEETESEARKLSRICALALIVTVSSNLAFHLLQLLWMRHLSVVNTFVNLPLTSILFALATLLLAQWIRENKQLKEDNDRFI
ncbi:MAG: hypothetical protein VB055_09780 [Oscillospiraceae bacterium]|nr:hypothetical protein [Oscillospiraceae bacterium]